MSFPLGVYNWPAMTYYLPSCVHCSRLYTAPHIDELQFAAYLYSCILIVCIYMSVEIDCRSWNDSRRYTLRVSSTVTSSRRTSSSDAVGRTWSARSTSSTWACLDRTCPPRPSGTYRFAPTAIWSERFATSARTVTSAQVGYVEFFVYFLWNVYIMWNIYTILIICDEVIFVFNHHKKVKQKTKLSSE